MTAPRLNHDQAEGVGQELAAFVMERTQMLDPLDELAWADAVQLVLRRSAEVCADAEEQEETERSDGKHDRAPAGAAQSQGDEANSTEDKAPDGAAEE